MAITTVRLHKEVPSVDWLHRSGVLGCRDLHRDFGLAPDLSSVLGSTFVNGLYDLMTLTWLHKMGTQYIQ